MTKPPKSPTSWHACPPFPPPHTDNDGRAATQAGEEPNEADFFIPLLEDSPPRGGPSEGAPPERPPRRGPEAHADAAAALAERRKQRMPWMADSLDRISSPLLRLHNGTPVAQQGAAASMSLYSRFNTGCLDIYFKETQR